MQDALMDILNFTADDLNANRQQRRSPAQQAAVKQSTQGFWKTAIYFVLFVIIVTFITWIIDPMPIFSPSNWGVVVGIVAVITVGILAVFFNIRRRYHLDAREDSVASVNGKLRLSPLGNSTDSGKLKVSGILFELSPEQFQALTALKPLPKGTVYFAPRSKHLFSVEIDSDEDDGEWE